MTTHSFLSAVKPFFKLFLCLLESFTSNRSSFAEDAFRANSKGLVLVSKALQYLLRD